MTSSARQIARDGLLRTKPFMLERADGDTGDGLTLRGHAAVFNEPTLIDSWEGKFREQIARGAFKKTFSERTPVLQFDHGSHPLVGSIPIGRIDEAREDTVGAFVQARLHDNWLVQPVRDAISEGSIGGMSFRFTVIREEWRDEDGRTVTNEDDLWSLLDAGVLTRTLKEVRCPELGPVVFPAYDGTDVGVRSGTTIIDLGALRRDPETRKKLARALWMAEQQKDTAPPPAGHPVIDDAPPVSGHPSKQPIVSEPNSAARALAEINARLAHSRGGRKGNG